VSIRLYWARNDGMTGHVFLSPHERSALEREMLLQGITLPELEPGVHVTATEVDEALESASSEPIALADRKLWADWLTFLRGASVNGGLLVR
jgi:hypothetical protein